MRSYNCVTERVEDADEEQAEQSSTHKGQEHTKQFDVEPVDAVGPTAASSSSLGGRCVPWLGEGLSMPSRIQHRSSQLRTETPAYCTKDGEVGRQLLGSSDKRSKRQHAHWR